MQNCKKYIWKIYTALSYVFFSTLIILAGFCVCASHGNFRFTEDYSVILCSVLCSINNKEKNTKK
jgi:hypothetical protein